LAWQSGVAVAARTKQLINLSAYRKHPSCKKAKVFGKKLFEYMVKDVNGVD
jgi:hypothetical protein